MNGLLQDIRFAFRQLRNNPGFAAVAILTLALGIGASTIIFSVVYNGLLHPFPYRSAERLTAITITDLEKDGRHSHSMYHLDEVAALRSGNHTFEDILGYGLWYVTYVRDNTALMLKGVGATPNAKDFWGVPPLLGRWFGEQDVQSGAPLVVVLNYRFWVREFHADKGVLGQTMMLNGKTRTIIGVMPPRFQAVGADLYMPVSWTRPEPVRNKFEWNLDDPFYFWATGILKKDANFATAAADIDVIARQLAPLHPDDYSKNFRVTMTWLNDVIVSSYKQTMFLLFAAVGLLLFISCSNVAGLLLAHASARTREIALRAALGAGRPRLMRQLLSESLVLALAGCAAGCGLAYLGLKGLMSTSLARMLPMEASVTLNYPVLGFAVAISLFATLLCGIAPALHAVRLDLQRGLASAGVNVDPSFHHSRFRSALVIGQVALSLLLLTGAGLVTRSYIALTRADLGIQPKKIFTASIYFPKGRYTKAEEKRVFFDRLLPDLSAQPGVVSATVLIGFPPFGGPRSDVTIPGKPHREPWNTEFELCSTSYFDTFGLRLLRGRLLSPEDVLGARKVVVVNQMLAKKFFPGEDPIGRQIKFNFMDEVPDTPRDIYFEIVGVVSDARNNGWADIGPSAGERWEATVPQAFMPYSISGVGNDRSIAMQTRVPPASLANHVRQILWSVDHDVVLVAPDVGEGNFSLDDVLGALVYSTPRFAAIAFSACAGLGFILAIVGLFSVMTYIVSLKLHDVGVRLALGAPRNAILQMMLRKGMVLMAPGIVIGLAVSIAVSILLTRFLAGLIYGISATDPLTFSLVVAAVILAGLSACFLPARRATTVDPMTTLRNE